MGMSELLLETALDEEQREYANVVHQEAEILLGLPTIFALFRN